MKAFLNPFLFALFFNFKAFSAESDKVTTSSSDFETTSFDDEIYDPIEPINRAIFTFNNYSYFISWKFVGITIVRRS